MREGRERSPRLFRANLSRYTPPVRRAVILLLFFSAPASAQSPQLLIIETHANGVDPVVARFVDRALRHEAEALGYAPSASGEGTRALQAQGFAYPPSMADLWRLLQRSPAERAVSALVWAEHGRYVVHVRIACRDGSGPFYAKGDAGAEDLEAVSAGLLQQALPPASVTGSVAESEPVPGSESVPDSESAPASGSESASVSESASESVSESASESAPSAVTPEPAEPHFFSDTTESPPTPGPRVRIAVREELAFGIAHDAFINDLIGARLDLGLSESTWVGAHLGYANLAGRHGRVHSVLPYAQLEQRIALGAGRSLALPLRVAAGYLIRNGGFVRVSSGLAVPLGRRAELAFDLLAPTFWSTPDAVLFSLDLGVELSATLP